MRSTSHKYRQLFEKRDKVEQIIAARPTNLTNPMLLNLKGKVQQLGERSRAPRVTVQPSAAVRNIGTSLMRVQLRVAITSTNAAAQTEAAEEAEMEM